MRILNYFFFLNPDLQIDLKEWYLEMYSLVLSKNPQSVTKCHDKRISGINFWPRGMDKYIESQKSLGWKGLLNAI